MDIVLATRNKKKVEEISRMLRGMDINILTLDDLISCPEVEEDKDTFEENAVKKAVEIANCTNKIAIADDSGLEVYALNCAPGVKSARYAGEKASDAANIEKLLKEMEGIPDEKRGARFVCYIALAFPITLPTPPLKKGGQGRVITFCGFAEGKIASRPRGRMGFGYDPIFYPSGYDKTFAEMLPEEKDAISHRRKALEGLKDYLKRII
jgi:XTP/dITP diphosphohydrolase